MKINQPVLLFQVFAIETIYTIYNALFALIYVSHIYTENYKNYDKLGNKYV